MYMKECGHNVRLKQQLPSFFFKIRVVGTKSFEVNWGLATTTTNSHHWFFGRWSMPKSFHHQWSQPHPLLLIHFPCFGDGGGKEEEEVLKDLFYFAQIDPYVTSVRLSFSPRYFFVGYYSEKREKNYLEKWDPLHLQNTSLNLQPNLT